MTKHVVVGSKGSKGASSASGSEAPNTLRSNANFQVVEVIGEGPTAGPPTSIYKDTYFNETPVQNADDTFNFQGVSLDYRTGYPDQDFMPGTENVQTPFTVETQVKIGTGPITRSIVDDNVDAVKVIIRIPALVSHNTTTGDILGASVAYSIHRRASGGSWELMFNENIINQKCTSPTQRQHVVELTSDGFPWDIKVTRLTPDSTVVELQNDTYWESYFEIVRGKLIYPNTAVVLSQANAQQFGTSVPTRAIRWKGLITSVPTNYDPVAKTYSGIWDGTFKQAWHSNPAWVFYALLTNSRWGLGEFIPASIVDKWSLYTIGRYCDELVPSGFNDEDGNPILEPRFAFNGVISSRQEAYKVLQDVASCFRGMGFWSLGQVFATADMPKDPDMIIDNTNVVDGHFKYVGTALKSRHSVILASWNDPDDLNRPSVELVMDDEALVRFGWRDKSVQLIGCTSRGQAHRMAQWMLYTEKNETETIQFDMSWDGFVLKNATLRPGSTVKVSDKRRQGSSRAGGRIVSIASTSSITLDAPFEPTIGESYNVTVVMPDGSLQTRDIDTFSNGNTTLTLHTALTTAPLVGARFAIQGTDLVARTYVINSVQEKESHVFTIVGQIINPNKYDAVEQNISLDPLPYTRPPNVSSKPINLAAVESHFFQDGVSHSRVILSWTSQNEFNVYDYLVTADSPHGFVDLGRTSTTSIDVMDASAGDWKFYVRSVSRTGLQSEAAELDFTVEGWAAVDGPVPDSLQIQGGGTSFGGRAPTITWENVFPSGSVEYPIENVVRVYTTTGSLLRTEVVSQTSYTYSYENNVNDGGPRRSVRIDVTAKAVTGTESSPASIVITNPVPAAVVPTLQQGVSNITVNYAPSDNDFAGALMWVSNTLAFSPTLMNYAYDGPDTSVVLAVPGGTTYYVWVAVYDAFGKTGLNLSTPISIAINNVTQEVARVIPDIKKALGSALDASVDDLAEAVAEFGAQIIQGRDETGIEIQKTRQELSAVSGNFSAQLIEERVARVTADEAEAALRLALQAQISDDVLAQIASEQTARASGDTALASSITSLTTTVSGHTANLTSIQTSVNGVQVQYGVIGTIDGVTGGFLFSGVKKLDGSVSYAVEIAGNLIVDGSVTAPKLSVSFLSAISAQMGTVNVGSKILLDGPNQRIVVSD